MDWEDVDTIAGLGLALAAVAVWYFSRGEDAMKNSGSVLRLPKPLPANVDALIQKYATQYGVDPDLIRAQAYQESRGNQSAKSPVGASGVMQLMPDTAKWLNADADGNGSVDLAENIEAGVRYMRNLLRQYGGDTEKALAAYNWGSGRVDKAVRNYGDSWVDHLPAETSDYLKKILGWWGA